MIDSEPPLLDRRTHEHIIDVGNVNSILDVFS